MITSREVLEVALHVIALGVRLMPEGVMRTTINVPESVLGELMRLTGTKTRTEAVNRALSEWVRSRRLGRLLALRGTLAFEGDLETLRALEIEEAGVEHV